MFPNGTIRRRLAALLRPWLREEPELELSLGLIGSHAVAKNLRFDTAAFNRLGDDSDGFSCKEVSVEQLSVRFSNWLAPAFSIEFHGVKVVLSTRKLKKKKKKLSEDTFAEDMKKKKLSEIDPQNGSSWLQVKWRFALRFGLNYSLPLLFALWLVSTWLYLLAPRRERSRRFESVQVCFVASHTKRERERESAGGRGLDWKQRNRRFLVLLLVWLAGCSGFWIKEVT